MLTCIIMWIKFFCPFWKLAYKRVWKPLEISTWTFQELLLGDNHLQLEYLRLCAKILKVSVTIVRGKNTRNFLKLPQKESLKTTIKKQNWQINLQSVHKHVSIDESLTNWTVTIFWFSTLLCISMLYPCC